MEDKSTAVIKTYERAIRERMAPFTDFPILFISALTKQRILKVLETAKAVYDNHQGGNSGEAAKAGAEMASSRAAKIMRFINFLLNIGPRSGGGIAGKLC